mmetsp:Transcript_459/g.1573  ORF Transcript_459/g.1573 Transcript_459/m.1573 type:complete len:211 (+) Transcript_459:355-987(+)
MGALHQSPDALLVLAAQRRFAERGGGDRVCALRSGGSFGRRHRAHPRRHVAALHVARQRRAALVRVRVGEPAFGDGLLGHLRGANLAPAEPLSGAAPVPVGRALGDALPAVPRHVRRRAHQAARGRVLARLDVHGRALRDAARPGHPVVALPLGAALVAQVRGFGQPRRRARPPVAPAPPRDARRPPARGDCSCRVPGGVPAPPHRERQP